MNVFFYLFFYFFFTPSLTYALNKDYGRFEAVYENTIILPKLEEITFFFISRNCAQCRRIHHKCNKKLPCDTCKEKNRLCSYNGVVKKRGRPKGSKNRASPENKNLVQNHAKKEKPPLRPRYTQTQIDDLIKRHQQKNIAIQLEEDNDITDEDWVHNHKKLKFGTIDYDNFIKSLNNKL